MKHGNGETRHPLVVALFQCPEGHMVTPPVREFMIRQAILCPLCDADPTRFEYVSVEDLPRTVEEYRLKVLEREEVELYGRKEEL